MAVPRHWMTREAAAQGLQKRWMPTHDVERLAILSVAELGTVADRDLRC
jgi:hypothetical protein